MITAIFLTIAALLVYVWCLGKLAQTVSEMEISVGILFVANLLAAIFFPFFPYLPSIIIGLGFLAIFVPHRLLPVRHFITGWVYRFMQKIMPSISDTEKIAIDAGDLSWEKQLFLGNCSGPMLEEASRFKLTTAEKKFIANETEELCRLCKPTDIAKHKELPPQVMNFIKNKKFWGMIIPRSHGGLGFSANAHAAVITKLASRSPILAVMVMVPNSLGPGELLLRYGTAKQKRYYLPRLASGKEIPCFALTSEVVGSDASGLEDYGIVCQQIIGGKKTIGIRMHWHKRYISLAPIATLIGIAFKAYDPDGLLSTKKKGELGITCALIPRNTKGVIIGKRHNPLDLMFHNGPIEGEDVFIPLDYVIGGEKMIGQGWRMLMECLAVGRGISLPSLADAGCQLSAWTATAYTQIREQFGLPIAQFEGVAKNIAHLAINSYVVTSVRLAAADMVDAGCKPALASAMAKLLTTERLRDSVSRAMDVHGGKAIMKGEKNYLEELYRSVPIGITVEGANILTRNMIIFGQGIMRCHPFLRAETEALMQKNKEKFSLLLWQHYIRTIKVKTTALTGTWSGGILLDYPSGLWSHHYRRLAILSAQFAYLADSALVFLGGELKRREALSARFADAWVSLFAAVATLRKFMQDEEPEIDFQLADIALKLLESETQKALVEILDNFPVSPPLRFLWKWLSFFPFGQNYKPPKDKELLNLAKKLEFPEGIAARLKPDLYLGKEGSLFQLDTAFSLNYKARQLRKKIKKEGYRKQPHQTLTDFLDSLVKEKKLTKSEKSVWLKADQAIRKVIAVDEFSHL